MKYWTKTLLALAVATLAGCGGDGGSSSADKPANTTDAYAGQSGATEPLYRFQWALKSASSFFRSFFLVADGKTDLNVEAVHRAGIKGQGVNVLVIDDGIDIHHEDLQANVDRSLSWNFHHDNDDPTPSDKEDAHGTHISGIIAAAQNGIGIMGIAPRARLGGTTFTSSPSNLARTYGGAEWSRRADVINLSAGENPAVPAHFEDNQPENLAIHSQLPLLRNGKGAVVLKSAGNEYVNHLNRHCPTINGIQIASCENPASDPLALEIPVINVAAANARGIKASYASAGALNWITGLGGEENTLGDYGEAGKLADEGPSLFTTDLSGCTLGKSRFYTSSEAAGKTRFLQAGTAINRQDNAQCNYAHLNGTSAAAPTLTGVVALMLSANPALSWRDVRDILRSTARKIDPDYGDKGQRNQQVNLGNARFVQPANNSPALVHGATSARLDFGWQKNAAGQKFSNWYGFGLVDAQAAVEKARTHTAYQASTLHLPPFSTLAALSRLTYGQVTELGKFTVSVNSKVDALQVRLSSPAQDLCIGSVGIYVKSPGGTLSILSVPYNIYYNSDSRLEKDHHFGLGSYAFYGEAARGEWTIYAVSGKPQASCTLADSGSIALDYRLIPQP